jgi:hypothetical protein
MEQTAIITLLITAIGVILAAKPGRRTTIAICTTFTLMGFFYVCILNLTKKEFKIIDMNLFLQWNISTPFLFTSAAIATLILIVMVRRKKRIKPPTDQHTPQVHGQETSQKTVDTQLPHKTRKYQAIDPIVKKYLPYSVNRSRQIEKMEISLLEPRIAHQLIWLIHGNEDQCTEELLNCVQLFYWKDFYGGKNSIQPEIIPIECPDASNESKFEPLMKHRIKIKLRTPNQSTENWNESDLMQLLDHYYEGPIIISTTLKTPELKQWKTRIISHLETLRKNLGQRESGLPLIFCIIVIYKEEKRSRRKDRKLNLNIKQGIENYSYITLPELSDIHKHDIEKWEEKDFVCQYLSTDDLSELHDMYQKPAYRNGVSMRVLADEIKHRYFS